MDVPVAPLWQQLLAHVIGFVSGPVIGFVSGWGLFELSERRKVRLAQRELRQAVVTELKHAEVLLSTIIGKNARLATSPEDVATVAHEIRWFVKVGSAHAQDSGVVLPDAAEGLSDFPETITDKQLVDLYAESAHQEIIGTKLVFPVVDSVLSGKTAGFLANEIQSLSTIKWQAYLLEQYADWTRQFLMMSFTVTDESNHGRVAANREASLWAYFQRSIVLQRCIRVALAIFRR